MLTSRSFPSFGWMMENPFSNATTVWEGWYFSDNTLSHNHPMFSSSETWMLQAVAGIQPHPAASGMDRVLIKPAPPLALTHAAGTFDTPRGRVGVSWARAAGKLLLNVTVPPNVRATVHVPSAAARPVREGGAAVRGGRRVGGRGPGGRGGSLVVEVGGGDWRFESEGV